MTTRSPSGITMLLRALAVLQGIAIAVLAVMVVGAAGPVAVNASPPPASPSRAAAQPAPGAGSAAQGGGTPAPAASTEPSSTPAKPTANESAARDALGTVLCGRIVDEAGEPILGARVWFSRPGDNQHVASASMSEREPCFAIAGFAPGDIAYRTLATGYKASSGSITIPPDTPRLRHDFVLTKAWEIAVRILTPDGKPVQAALREQAKGRPMLYHVDVGAVATATQPDGDFPVTGLREIRAGIGRWREGSDQDARPRDKGQPANDVAGVLEVDGQQPVWVSAVLRHRVLASAPVEPGQDEVTLTVSVDRVLRDLGTIRGRVVDAATRAPVTGAHVGFGDQQSGGGRDQVDSEGRFEVRDLRPGLLTIEIIVGNRWVLRDLVVLEPGQVLDLGDVPLAEYRTITGHCEGLTGKAESCHVTSMSLDPPRHQSMRHDSGHATVAADGTFKLYVTDGRYRLRASGGGGAVMDIDTRTLPDGPLVLKLEKEANLRIDVQSNGEPFELAVFDASGRELYRRELLSGWKFPLPFLRGDYRVELKDSRGKVETRRVTLGEDGADLRVP